MDPKTYERFLDEKIADAKHNLDHAAKDYLEAKAKYELVLFEKESFIKSMREGEFGWTS
jgi:hypothetical protein